MTNWQGPNLTESLSGEKPLFLVHRSFQNANRLPETLDYLSGSHGDDLALGVVARLPRMTANTMRNFAQAVSHVPVRIVDPELWRHPDSGWPEAKALKSPATDWTYLTKQPDKPIRAWAKAVLDAQRAHNASVLLSATGWVTSNDGQRALQRALSWMDESRQEAGNVPFWVNLTLDYSWLTDKTLRNTLIEEIVESNEQHWYLRFWWPEVPTRYGQLLDESVLEGYRTLARECDVEEKRLYLPNSGLTGWVASALGAAGFSTGMSWPEQAFARERPIARRPGVPAPPRIPRLFDGMLLHTMEYGEYLRIRETSGHNEWRTPFLDETERRGHSPELAGLHYVASAGTLTAQLAHRRPNVAAERLVRQAQTFLNGLSPAEQLIGINRPTHLESWNTLLS